MTGARHVALFVSGLQRSEVPTAAMAAEAITPTVRRFGIHGCLSRWLKSSATTPTQPPTACAGFASYEIQANSDHYRTPARGAA